MNSKDLYNAIGKVDDDVLEQSEVAKKKIGWLKWGALAACLCLTVGALLWPKGPQVAVKEIGSLEEAAASYGDHLLAERLSAPGVRTTGIRLSYTKGGDASDPAAWDTLSITGDYNGQDFIMDCNFNGQGKQISSAEAYAVTQYGDVEVTIYKRKATGAIVSRSSIGPSLFWTTWPTIYPSILINRRIFTPIWTWFWVKLKSAGISLELR